MSKRKTKKGGIFMMMFIICVIVPVYQLDLLNFQSKEPQVGVIDVWATWGDSPEQLQELLDSSEQPVQVVTQKRSDEIEKALNSETPPDMIILSGNQLVKSYHDQGWIEPLDPWIEKVGMDISDMFAAPLAQCQLPDQGVICLPWGADVFALFWNKDLFQAAGLDPEQPPQTMAELVDYAVRLTTRDEDGELIQAGYLLDDPRTHTALISRMLAGSAQDGTAAYAADPAAMVQALHWQRDFYSPDVRPEMEAFARSVNRYLKSSHPIYAGERMNCQGCHRSTQFDLEKIPGSAFYQGQVAMMVDAQWQLTTHYLASLNPALNYGVIPFPPPADHPDRAGTAMVRGPVVILPKGAADLDAAASLLAWMMSPEIAAEAAYQHAAIPASLSVARDARFQEMPFFDVFLGALSGDNAFSLEATSTSPALNQELESVERGFIYEAEEPPVSLLEDNLAGNE